MEKNTCFICLEDTNEAKKCIQCNCYAHYTCFSKYIRKILKLKAQIKQKDNNLCLLVGNYYNCPICRIENYNYRRVTRKDTIIFRNFFVSNIVRDLLSKKTEMNEISTFHTIMKIMNKHPDILKNNETLKIFLKCNMIRLHREKNWKMANFYLVTLLN